MIEPHRYSIAEKFKSVQGEGVYAGQPMAFIRFVGCSVSKKVCHHCDTDFDDTYDWKGGGKFMPQALMDWAAPYRHLCLTGGEPLDQDLSHMFKLMKSDTVLHIETSGTVIPSWYTQLPIKNVWITVCPKPGYTHEMISMASELKVIVGGLGNGPGWPTLDQAVRWQRDLQIPVFLQPRNKKEEVDPIQLNLAEELVRNNPTLRLSVQMHKLLRVR